MPVVKCVTMQRDESVLLEAWLRYHGYLFGFENLTVIDNGSVLPDVLETMARAESAGVTVYRQFPTTEDYARKGVITTNVVRAIDNRSEYDFMLPLDCDEFFSVWTQAGVSARRSDILRALDALDPAETHFRINHCLYNDPGRPGWFSAQGALKGFLRSRSIDQLDHGNHLFSQKPDFTMAPCDFTHLHYHHKAFTTLVEHTRWKLAPFVDVTDEARVRSFDGPGKHLLRNLFLTPEEYHRQFEDRLTFYFDGFSHLASLLGMDRGLFTIVEPCTDVPSGHVRMRPAGAGSALPAFDFSPERYRHANLDVAAAGADPLRHYLLTGFQEPRALG